MPQQLALCIVKRASRVSDGLEETVFGDIDPAPDAVEQLCLGERATVCRRERDDEFERLRPKGDFAALVTKQPAARRLDYEALEADRRWGCRHVLAAGAALGRDGADRGSAGHHSARSGTGIGADGLDARGRQQLPSGRADRTADRQ